MTEVEIRHFHIACGLGAGAKGFNKGEARVGNLRARFRCLGGIDVDPAGLRDFARLAGVKGTRLDLFSRDQYIAFHGHEPPDDWREAIVADFHRAAGYERPHIVFASLPCKGFSGLLAQAKSIGPKYQALNGLTLRAVWLMCEAWKGDPPELFVFENVPRIATRGRHLLDQIVAILRSYGYAVAETTHDCGEIGHLAQSRKRFLMVARHMEKVPPFLYQPTKHSLRGVGEVLERFPLPGPDPVMPMHRVPSLQWKTWVRLAFVEAGSDWRSLNRLKVDDGVLADYGIAPESDWQAGVLGVNGWEDSAPTVSGRGGPTNGAYSVADPRAPQEFSSADRAAYGVGGWDDPAATVTSQRSPGQGRFSVADPRIDGHEKSVQMGVRRWDQPAGVVTGKMFVGGGPHAVADPRLEGKPRFNNVYRIVEWSGSSPAVAGPGGPAGGLAVADPRAETGYGGKGKYRVTPFDGQAGTVIGASTTGNGAFAVADPRPAGFKGGREHFEGGGHYGVVPWARHANTVASSSQIDNGFWSVADPRSLQKPEPDSGAEVGSGKLPAPADRLFCLIRALDGTWHRPFTTLELAALQGLVDPEETLELDGMSDSAWRERIGNAVPPPAAKAIASVMGRTLLMAWSGETFLLSNEDIWVRDVAVALSVDQGVNS